MIKKKILVVGGGFRGIVIADKLKKSNNVDLVEKLPYLGGILYSEKWNEFYLDKGIHLFDNTNDHDTKLIQKILENKYLKISLKGGSRITNQTSDVVAIPDFTTLSSNLQLKIARELFECAFKKKDSKNLHEYLINNFGKTAGKYLITAAKKYFAIDPKQLSPDAHRNHPVSRGRFFNDEISTFLKNFEEFENKIALPVYNNPMKWHKDVSDKSYRYFYPIKKGLRGFSDDAIEYLRKMNVNVSTNIFLNTLKQKNGKLYCGFSNGYEKIYDHVVWTTNPTHLLKIISKNKPIIDSGIHFVPMIIFYFIVNVKNINDFSYIQDFTNDTIALRGAATGLLGKQIINNKTYIDVEVPTQINSKIWLHPELFYERIWNDVVKMGLVKGKMPKTKKFVKTPFSFRAAKKNFSKSNQNLENKIKKFSNKIILVDQENAQLSKILQSLNKTKI